MIPVRAGSGFKTSDGSGQVVEQSCRSVLFHDELELRLEESDITHAIHENIDDSPGGMDFLEKVNEGVVPLVFFIESRNHEVIGRVMTVLDDMKLLTPVPAELVCIVGNRIVDEQLTEPMPLLGAKPPPVSPDQQVQHRPPVDRPSDHGFKDVVTRSETSSGTRLHGGQKRSIERADHSGG